MLLKQKYKESKRNKALEFAKCIKKPIIRKPEIGESPTKNSEMNEFN